MSLSLAGQAMGTHGVQCLRAEPCTGKAPARQGKRLERSAHGPVWYEGLAYMRPDEDRSRGTRGLCERHKKKSAQLQRCRISSVTQAKYILCMVSRAGLEPARHSHCPLKTACLPVPPPRQRKGYIQCTLKKGKQKVRISEKYFLSGNPDELERRPVSALRPPFCMQHGRSCANPC